MAVLLYNRTTYSFLQSALKVEDLFAYAQKEGFHAVGIADQRVLYGFAKAREYEKKTGIHVVYGLEVPAAYEDRVLPFVVFAKNDDGYRVLCRLSEKAQKEKAPLDINRIGELSRDLVCVLPDKGLEDLLYAADEEALENILRYFSNAVSSVYVGKGNASGPLYKRGNEILDALCRKYHLPCAAFPLGLYKPGDLDLYKAVQAIDQEVTIDDRYLRFDKNTVLKTAEELREYTEEEVFNSERIAALCKVTLEDRKASLPDYPCPHGADPKEYLRSLAAAGLKKRLNGKVTKEYSDRLRYELDTIVRMGFADYFLIVYGMILFARRNGITLGPGRGSAPGSLIAYCLGITHVDPIKYGLLFERFLNPMRHTMPDIDTDVPDNKREDFIRYLCDTYGEEHVSHIIAFTTYGARQTLTDLGRVLKIPAGMLDTVRKLLPKGPKITLQKAYSTSEAFRRYIESSAELRSLYAIGCRLEGFQRNVTTHAAGIVLSKEKVRDIIPLHYEEGKLPSTQYTMEYLEPLGLIKFDILGVINLTVIHQTLETVRKEEPEIDLFKISYEDPEVYAVFSRGQTVSIFQSKSQGMKSLLKRIEPKNIEELSLVFALYRPGPMNNAEEYIARKKDPSKIRYPHPSLEPILKETLGIIVYQEQIMKISQVMAGFTLGEADILRKSMSKKKAEELESMHASFIAGSVKNGYDENLAEEVFRLIEKFAEYGFNKSHSVVYAVFAYQMAYLKRYYPDAFYLGVLEQNLGNAEVTAGAIAELGSFGIRILRPDVIDSNASYKREGKDLRLPLRAVKGIPSVLARNIEEEREENGPYPDIFDAVNRIAECGADDTRIRNLIDAGAFDRFGYNRETLRNGLDSILSYGRLNQNQVNGKMRYTPGLVPKHKITAYYADKKKDLEKEQEVLGFYLHGHPIAMIRKENFPKAISLADAIRQKGNVCVVIEVKKAREHTTKNQEKMAFVTGYDETTEYDFAIMPEYYAKTKELWKTKNVLYIEGVIGSRDSCLVKNVIKYEPNNGSGVVS